MRLREFTESWTARQSASQLITTRRSSIYRSACNCILNQYKHVEIHTTIPQDHQNVFLRLKHPLRPLLCEEAFPRGGETQSSRNTFCYNAHIHVSESQLPVSSLSLIYVSEDYVKYLRDIRMWFTNKLQDLVSTKKDPLFYTTVPTPQPRSGWDRTSKPPLQETRTIHLSCHKTWANHCFRTGYVTRRLAPAHAPVAYHCSRTHYIIYRNRQ